MTPQDLKALRSRLGMTQKELAEAVGVWPATVARWEQGGRGIPEPVARLLIRIGAEKQTEPT